MEENPPTKGMNPIRGIVMYNFLYWLLKYHHELEDLQTLSETQLLYLTTQFENSRPDIERNKPIVWLQGVEKLFSEVTEQDDYDAARKLLHRYK